MYLTNISLENRLFEISCKDIAGPEFVSWFDDFMQNSNVSDNYNTDYVNGFHHNYTNAQENLKWFDSIAHWEATGELSEYLTSHSGIEAQMISYIFELSGRMGKHSSKDQRLKWLLYYNSFRGSDWPVTTSEIDFFRLPADIQEELRRHEYPFSIKNPVLEIVDLDWENLSLYEINQVYQKAKSTS